jgi:hypothetical protein
MGLDVTCLLARVCGYLPPSQRRRAAEILAFFCANFIAGVYATTGISSLSNDFGNKATSLENKPNLSKLVEKQPV